MSEPTNPSTQCKHGRTERITPVTENCLDCGWKLFRPIGFSAEGELQVICETADSDTDGALVPLPQKPQPEEKPYIPQKFGEHD